MFSVRMSREGTKSNFFDRAKVLAATEKAVIAPLSKFGAFLRRTAKGLIRKGNKPSKPGNPPKSHTDFLKNNIFFAWDPGRRSVVTGPTKLNNVFFEGNGRPVYGTVPQVLEEGGSIHVLEWQLPHSGKWVRADLRFKRNRGNWKRRLRGARIEARPFMHPAFEKEKKNLPPQFANCLERAA